MEHDLATLSSLLFNSNLHLIDELPLNILIKLEDYYYALIPNRLDEIIPERIHAYVFMYI